MDQKVEAPIIKPEYVTYIKPEDLFSLQGKAQMGEFNFIDVRKPEEFAAFHVEGAALIPVDDLEKNIYRLDKDKMTLIYCKAGKRCMRGAEILHHKGFDNILVLEGGMESYHKFLTTIKK